VTGTIKKTSFTFPGQTQFAIGSVRDIYTIDATYLAMVVTDRISAFDVVLPVSIPSKGQVLAGIATYFLNATKDIIPNWLITQPDPNVMVGYLCKPYKIEVVVRGYLTGHAWREYKAGKRSLSGVVLPEGMEEYDKFSKPIITPATHASVGHDEDISREDIITRGYIPEAEYVLIEKYALKLFARGTQMAADRGLILVDTKYEFGKHNGQLTLMDEVHTPDSSRYFYADGFKTRTSASERPKSLSKEFVREWLMAHNFSGQDSQTMPVIPEEFVEEISERYIELYEALTGKRFKPAPKSNRIEKIEQNTIKALNSLVSSSSPIESA
jgi:phosphoribosylaminoimidazole-succinocarboxamide synthase